MPNATERQYVNYQRSFGPSGFRLAGFFSASQYFFRPRGRKKRSRRGAIRPPDAAERGAGAASPPPKSAHAASVKLNEIVNQEVTVCYRVLKSCLLSGFINDSCRKYPELDAHLLRKRLEKFYRQFKYKAVAEAASVNVMRQQVLEVCLLFSQVETLIRLLLHGHPNHH